MNEHIFLDSNSSASLLNSLAVFPDDKVSWKLILQTWVLVGISRYYMFICYIISYGLISLPFQNILVGLSLTHNEAQTYEFYPISTGSS